MDYLSDYDERDGTLSFRQRFSLHHVVIFPQRGVCDRSRLDLTIAEGSPERNVCLEETSDTVLYAKRRSRHKSWSRLSRSMPR